MQLTFTVVPPPSGAARAAQFILNTEFGDARVQRAIALDFGDGTTMEASVHQWSCWDPAAPNPYLFTGPTHEYAASGTYVVTATVRTAPCAADDDDGLPE
ncbi:MAG: hypothetical protein ACRDQ2_14165, partial [Gaiellales bacterium]